MLWAKYQEFLYRELFIWSGLLEALDPLGKTARKTKRTVRVQKGASSTQGPFCGALQKLPKGGP